MADWELRITTWRGLLGAARHYYGEILEASGGADGRFENEKGGITWSPERGYPRRIHVTWEIDAAEARRLNEQQGGSWEAGEEAAGFYTLEELVSAATGLFGAEQEAGRIAQGDVLKLDGEVLT